MGGYIVANSQVDDCISYYNNEKYVEPIENSILLRNGTRLQLDDKEMCLYLIIMMDLPYMQDLPLEGVSDLSLSDILKEAEMFDETIRLGLEDICGTVKSLVDKGVLSSGFKFRVGY